MIQQQIAILASHRQIRWVAGDDLPRQIEFIDHLFDLAA
jgi:hypothetical protein